MPRYRDLTKQRFGRLTALARTLKQGKHTMWYCECDCGNITRVSLINLTTGHTKSCGCFQQESRIDHGLSKHPLNAVWRSARARCNNPKDKAFKHYGGRGIIFCKDWDKFEDFYNWAINNGYEIGLELDRIDNGGPYSPENCRWATRKEQCNNTRQNKYLTFKGVTKNYTQWAKDTGLKLQTVYGRISRGKSPEEAFGLV